MGSWAVDLALSVGIFPYVLKLLQTTSSDLRTTLVFIWAKILALDRSCQADLVKDNGHLYFLKYLDSPEPGIDNHNRAQAAFVLAVVCDHHAKGQALCAAANLLQVCMGLAVLLCSSSCQANLLRRRDRACRKSSLFHAPCVQDYGMYCGTFPLC
jgi:regulator-associated protein of mTOR